MPASNAPPLQAYRQKRDFRITPEPSGRVGRPKSEGLSFVIQKHAATNLHYDFRLELDGVMLSWAVPKGPSLDPNDKRLAAQTEDHPLEYSEFEGVIPKNQYGGGTVLLWDRGTWRPKEEPRAGFKKGKLKFELHGDKLHGGWILVKSRGGKYGSSGKTWLLIKEDDDYAVPANDASITEDKPGSVATGRSLEEIAVEKDRVWESNKTVAENVKAQRKATKRKVVDPSNLKGVAKATMPKLIKPQLATLVKNVPKSGNWLYEIKFDGYRMLCRVEAGQARLISRNGKDWTANFAHLAAAAGRLAVDTAWLDGEIVVLDEKGRSSFQALQNALSLKDKTRLAFYVFDLPYLNGYDLRKVRLSERKGILERVLDHPPAGLKYSAHFETPGNEFFAEACKLGLEGIIAKAATSAYFEGRNRNWLKIKCAMKQEMVIGGYTDPESSRTGFGALLLGVYEPDGSLRYSGKVGTGFNEATLASLYKKLRVLEQDKPAFINPPKGVEARRSHWVKPELVAEVTFTEWSNEGTLRHPSFQGLREDKQARDVIRERPAEDAPPAISQFKLARAAKTGKEAVTDFKLTNPDKLLYPEASLSKKDLVAFYLAIGKWIIPHLEGRPLALVRCPNGWDKPCFFQKKADATVDKALERVEVQTSGGGELYMMANTLQAVLALVQMGVLEIHPWGSKSPRLGFPDRIIFDLDPHDAVPWNTLVETARLLNTLLEEIGLRGFLKTTGGKGLHVVVPIQPKHSWEVIKGFSKTVADLLVRTFPDRFTSKITKSSRTGKVFIDYLRNAEGSTAVAAYSIRARANAPVATPIHWSEVKTDVRFEHFNVRNLPARLKKLAKDPWADFFTIRQSLSTKAMAKIGYTPSQ